MEQEFLDWYEQNQERFHQGQFDDKQIAYSAWLQGRMFRLGIVTLKGVDGDDWVFGLYPSVEDAKIAVAKFIEEGGTAKGEFEYHNSIVIHDLLHFMNKCSILGLIK